MTKINGHTCPQQITVPEHGEVGDTRLIRSAINVWLVNRGLAQAESYLGIRGAAALARRRARKKRIDAKK